MEEKPIAIAASTYDEECERTFDNDLIYYISKGYVYSGNDAFVMAKPIARRDSSFVLDEGFTYKEKDCDAWFVYLAAGKGVHRFQELAPFKLPYVCWHRRTDSKLRFYDWDKFQKKAKEINKNG